MQQPTNIPDDKKGEEKAVDEVNTVYNWGGTVCKHTLRVWTGAEWTWEMLLGIQATSMCH